MRIRDVVVWSFLFAGIELLRPGTVAATVCLVGDTCMGTRVVDAPIGCKTSASATYCYTDYGRGTASCDSECTYGVINYAFPYSFKECAPDAVPPFCNSTVPSSIGPGTCCQSDIGGGGVNCQTTAPSRLSIDRDFPGTKINVTWSPGSGGVQQAIVVSDNPLAAKYNCSAAAGYTAADCVVLTYLSSGVSSYQILKTKFAANTVYYFKIIETAGPCSASTLRPWISTCSLTPSSLTLNPSATRTLTMPIVDTLTAWTSFKRVDFSSNNTAVATVSPASDLNNLTIN